MKVIKHRVIYEIVILTDYCINATPLRYANEPFQTNFDEQWVDGNVNTTLDIVW